MRRGPESRRKARLRRRRAATRRRRRSSSLVDVRAREAEKERALFMRSASASALSRVMPWLCHHTGGSGCWRKGWGTRTGWRTAHRHSHRWNTDRLDSRIPGPGSAVVALAPGPAPARGWGPGPEPVSAPARGRRGLRREAEACSTHLSASREFPPERRCSGARSARGVHRARHGRPGRQRALWWMSRPTVRPEEPAARPGRVHDRTGRSSRRTSRPRQPPRTQDSAASETSDPEHACAPSAVAPALSDVPCGRATKNVAGSSPRSLPQPPAPATTQIVNGDL